MKRLRVIVGVMTAVTLVLASTGPAGAAGNLLTNPGFESFTGIFTTNTPVAASNSATWNQWLAFERWQARLGTFTISPPGWTDNNFAIHDQNLNGQFSDFTDQIKQGIAGTAVLPNVPVTVSFQYINTGPDNTARPGTVEVYGLASGATWSQFAPWPCGGGGGCTLLYSASLPPKSSWTAFSGTFTPTATYAAVAIGLTFGGPVGQSGSGLRGVDQVSLSQNQPPDCSDASASPSSLWPPNHQFVPVQVIGVTDPDGDPVTITVNSIFQDEPVLSPGSGNTSPDGTGVGTSTAQLRAEREGAGNGRVYHVAFTADDGNGGTCTGEVLVGVPKSQGAKAGPVDDGALYDSTAP